MTGLDQAHDDTTDRDDTLELVAQLRQLAGADPAAVRQVVAEVLTALDRAAGGALRDQVPEAIRLDAGWDTAEPRHL